MQLPQSSDTPDSAAARHTRAAGDHRHGRGRLSGQRAHPSSTRVRTRLRAALLKEAGTERGPDHHSRGRAHVRTRRWSPPWMWRGKLRLLPAQYRHRARGHKTLSRAAAADKARWRRLPEPGSGRGQKARRRLLGDLSQAAEVRHPVSGRVLDRRARHAMLFSATQCGARVPGQAVLQRRLRDVKDPEDPLADSLGRRGRCSRLRGIGDYVARATIPSWVGRQVVKGLRRDVFSHYLRLPTAYLDRQQSGHLLSKLTNNIELVAGSGDHARLSR